MLLNGSIGFAHSLQGWPSPLMEQGYSLYWVGPSYIVLGRNRVNPDLLFVSTRLNHCLILECKSGVTTGERQLESLAATTRDNLIQSANVTFQNPSTAEFDIVIVCFSEHSGALGKTLNAGGYSFPLLVVDRVAGRASLERGRLSVNTMSAVLEKGVSFDPELWPLQFIPYDAASEPADIANCVIPKVVSLMKLGAPHFDLADIVRDTCPVSNRLHPREKTELIKKIRSVLRLAANGEFRGLLRPIDGGQYQDKWIVTDSIKFGGIPKKVGARSLSRRTADFISRLKSGAPFTSFEEVEEGWQPSMDLESDRVS